MAQHARTHKRCILKRPYGQVWQSAPACSGNHCRREIVIRLGRSPCQDIVMLCTPCWGRRAKKTFCGWLGTI